MDCPKIPEGYRKLLRALNLETHKPDKFEKTDNAKHL